MKQPQILFINHQIKILIKIMDVGTLTGMNLKYQRIHRVTSDRYYRNTFVEKEIPTSFNKFDCLNIKDVVIKTGLPHRHKIIKCCKNLKFRIFVIKCHKN